MGVEGDFLSEKWHGEETIIRKVKVLIFEIWLFPFDSLYFLLFLWMAKPPGLVFE
ncbi:hypothetical protein C943_03753 [Mariniradius saccharolyticus AK6]|uniref:Uncharacterized protein n=1 Tax=Mariniradius saccharolyticus AK6 TaxID=1239962 RepID=M7XJ03_9BACT|nr:hypothetical protein C943_03753 [Mariniradius saccharolyticus AK6]